MTENNTTTTPIDTLLNTLVGQEGKTAKEEVKISRLMGELKKARESRDSLEAKFIQGTLQSIADHFKRDQVDYSDINKYMLNSINLSPANWAFSAKGAPVSVSTVKNRVTYKEEGMRLKLEEVAKGGTFAKLNRFEAIKGRKFTQGAKGYAVLKQIIVDGKLVANPEVPKKNTTATTAPTTPDTPQVGDQAGFVSKGGILKGIVGLLEQIESSPILLDDSKILAHLAMAQRLLAKEAQEAPELELDTDLV